MINHINFKCIFNKTHLNYRNKLLLAYVTTHFIQKPKEKQVYAKGLFHCVADTISTVVNMQYI